MKSDHVKFRRAKETNFLIMDEIIFDLFSPYALKVYGQLRKLMSYTQQCDEVEITVKNLAALSGISERKTYDVLNELEYTHHIIQRLNIYHFRYGQTNTFDVSQTYGFYKTEQESNTPAPCAEAVDNCVQKLTPSAQYAEGTAQYAEGTAQYADLIKQDLSQEVPKKKQNKETVFSDTDSVKTHLTLVSGKRGQFLEDDTVEQIIFYLGKEKNYNVVTKKINIALKLIREGKWNIPQGWNGITTQSIREKDNQYEREKQEQIQKDGVIARAIKTAVKTGNRQSLSEMLKDFSNANQGTMPETDLQTCNKTRG